MKFQCSIKCYRNYGTLNVRSLHYLFDFISFYSVTLFTPASPSLTSLMLYSLNYHRHACRMVTELTVPS